VTRHDKSGGVSMAKQAADTFTLDLLDKPKRGRPRKPDALTDAERARRYRARKKAAIDLAACTELEAALARLRVAFESFP
jgi:hypothetical protein